MFYQKQCIYFKEERIRVKQMDFEKFVNRVMEDIKKYLSQEDQNVDFAVEHQEKLNDQYTALRITGRTITPNINLEYFYREYEDGRSFRSIMSEIAESIEMVPPKFEQDVLNDFEKAKELLFIRLSSVEKNADYLEKVPHTIVEDMAITYHLIIEIGEQGVASATITNEYLEKYGATVEELHKLALENSEKIFPANIDNILGVMQKQIAADMKKEGMDEETINMILDELPPMENPAMTIVTNDVCVNGAAVIFYPGVFEEIAERTGGDYFVLPSSVHETIILPDTGEYSTEELTAMVSDINANVVEERDRLTDEVYHYDSIDKVFEKASKFEERMISKLAEERNAKLPSIKDRIYEKKDAVKVLVGESKMPVHKAEVSR